MPLEARSEKSGGCRQRRVVLVTLSRLEEIEGAFLQRMSRPAVRLIMCGVTWGYCICCSFAGEHCSRSDSNSVVSLLVLVSLLGDGPETSSAGRRGG